MGEEKKVKIKAVFQQFIQNVESIEIFFEKLSLRAIEEDQTIIDAKKKYFENLLRSSFGEEAAQKFSNEIDKTPHKDFNIRFADKEEVDDLENDDDLDEDSVAGALNEDLYNSFIYKLFKAPKIQTKNFEILSSSTFLILNNYFEFLFADLLTFHFTNNKNLIEEKNITISLNELKNYSNIEEAYDEILFKEVEKLLLDLTFDEIKNYFKKLGVSLAEEIIKWDFINEIRERRHLIVHNNSVVNKKYLAKTDNYLPLKVGESVKVNEDYLKQAIDEIQIAGVILIMNCWGKWQKDSATDAIIEMLNFSFDLLKKSKFSQVIKICEYVDCNIKPRNDDEEDCVLKTKFNYCIALKKTGQIQKLDKKLKDIRTSTLTPIFKIAKHILSNQNQEAISLFAQAIIVDEFIIDHYLEWPIFEDLRNDEELNKMAISKFQQKLLN